MCSNDFARRRKQRGRAHCVWVQWFRNYGTRRASAASRPGEAKSFRFLVFSCKWRGGKSGNRNRKLEIRNWKPGEETSGYGGGVKSIKTRRLAKGGPPTRSGCAGSSATLSIPQSRVEHKWRAETADRDGPPKGVFMDRGSVTCRISGEFIKESCGRRTAAHQGMRSTDPRPRGIGGP